MARCARLSWLFPMAIGAWVATQASAKGGALPKGDAAQVDKGKASGPKAAPVQDLSCYARFARPVGGNTQFGDGAYYVLGQTSAFGKASDPQKPTVRYTFFRVPLGAAPLAADPLLSLEHRSGVALAAYGVPVHSLAAVGFLGNKSACFEGPAAVVNVTLAKKGDQAIRTTGTFSFVDTPEGRRLVDEKKRTLLEMDPVTFQTKASRKLAPHERGLYFDPETRAFTAWHDDGKQRGLVHYRGEDDAAPRRLAVNARDLVVQRGARFAVARLDAKANAVTIQELADWTGVTAPAVHRFKLPAAYKVGAAGMDVDFDKRVALVYAVGFAAQRQWQRLFVVDYAKGRLLHTLRVTGDAFFHTAGLDPSGRYVVGEVRDERSRRSLSLRVLDLSSSKTTDVALSAP